MYSFDDIPVDISCWFAGSLSGNGSATTWSKKRGHVRIGA